MHGQPLSTREALDLMLTVNPKHITINLINGVQCNSIFACEVKSETQRLDIRRDDMGVWLEGKRFIKLSYCGSKPVTEDQADCFVWRTTFTCKSHPALKKTEIFRRRCESDGSVGSIMSPMVVCYRFMDNDPRGINVKPHGNSKGTLPFYPTTKSLLKELQQATENNVHKNPGTIYNKVRTNVLQIINIY